MGSLISDVAFIRGAIAGFLLAVPLGPVAILCIRRALARGQIECIIAGFGAALADTIFGAVAGLGITFISSFVVAHEIIIGLLGGMIVLAVGIATYRTPVCHVTGTAQVQSLRRDVVTAFTMAITNPATMLGAAGIFATFGPVDISTEPIKAFWLVFGVFTGSMAWWIILSMAVGTLKQRFVDGGLLMLNRVSGAVITLSGVAVMVTVTYRALT
jgi:threonine/homoserine/homoserine lactone efflux protein